jgi:hypothetical protein
MLGSTADFKPIISKDNQLSSEFILYGLEAFRKELLFYVEQNQDPSVLAYGNEQTMTSLFLMGLVRQESEKKISGLQEYSLFREEGGFKRPDLFVKYGEEAYWIESKIDRTFKPIDHSQHWNISAWLTWDQAAMEQAQTYYDCEKKDLNGKYSDGHFVMTLCFKTVKESPLEYLEIAGNKLQGALESVDRSWFYDCPFLDYEEDGKFHGLEIYGTWKRAL